MRAGSLRHRVTIVKPGYTTTSYGQKKPDWVNVADMWELWASIVKSSGNEVVEGEQQVARGEYAITVRYTEGIDETCRVELNNRFFDISAVDNVEERNRELVLTAIERKENVSPTSG